MFTLSICGLSFTMTWLPAAHPDWRLGSQGLVYYDYTGRLRSPHEDSSPRTTSSSSARAGAGHCWLGPTACPGTQPLLTANLVRFECIFIIYPTFYLFMRIVDFLIWTYVISFNYMYLLLFNFFWGPMWYDLIFHLTFLFILVKFLIPMYCKSVEINCFTWILNVSFPHFSVICYSMGSQKR